MSCKPACSIGKWIEEGLFSIAFNRQGTEASMKSTCTPLLKRTILTLQGMLAVLGFSIGQTPVISVRLANPQNDCVTEEYCLDVEFKSSLPDFELFGMNVRFFYNDATLELVNFRDFQGGYGPIAPDPPIITTSGPAGPALFNFEGPAEFVNGAVQLVNTGEPPIILDTSAWTKLFQICFLVDDPNANLDTFCPSVVWDLEQDPLNGGFLAGDDGVVMTIVDPDPNNESQPANEGVIPFNWEYTGDGSPPYGEPVDLVCSNINCALPLNLLFFKGTSSSDGNLLQWKVEHQAEITNFIIQRYDGLNVWQDLGRVDATNQSASIEEYAFTDRSPKPGRNYYRLASVDRAGRAIFSKILALTYEESHGPNDFVVYPNPANADVLYIETLEGLGPGHHTYSLLNIWGSILQHGELKESLTRLDIHTLSPGIYYLMLTSSWVIESKKIIVK